MYFLKNYNYQTNIDLLSKFATKIVKSFKTQLYTPKDFQGYFCRYF